MASEINPLKEWQRHLAVVGFLALWCIFFFWPVLTFDQEQRLYFPAGDFSDQFYLFTLYASQRIKAGELPLWNPYTLSGHPFIADVQSAVFYPLRLLTIFLSGPGRFPFHALELEAIFHFFLGSLFTYFFVFRILRSRIPALVSAIVFAYGGYLTSYPPLQLAILEVDIWLPLILLILDRAWEKFEKEKARFPFALAGIIFGISILAGHPQSSMYVFYTSLLYFLFRGYRHARWQESGGLLAIFLTTGFGLSAAQIIPSIEYLSLSTRAQTTYEQVAHGFLPEEFIQLLLPESLTVWSPMYVGILPLLLGIWGVVQRPNRWPLFWAGLAIASLFLSLGENFFLYRLFYVAVPGFSMFRGQERAIFLFSFSIAVLAGYGTASLLPSQIVSAEERVKAFLRLALLAVAEGLFLLGVILYTSLREDFSTNSILDGELRGGLVLLLFFALSTAFIWTRGRSPIPISSFTALVLAFILLDLFLVNSTNNLMSTNPEDNYRLRAWIEPILAEQGLFRVDNWAGGARNYGVAYALQEISGSSPLRLQRYRSLLSLPRERIWQLLSVKYVRASTPTLEMESEIVHQEFRTNGEFFLHRLATPTPRAYVTYEVAVMSDRKALRVLSDPQWDIQSTVILAEESPFPALDSPIAGHMANITLYEPEKIVIEADARANGFLILSEIFYPGWRATVDGIGAKIYRANYTLHAIPLTPGKHTVEMVYDPPSVKMGISISLLTLAAFLVAGTTYWRRNICG
ncbi:MAG: YfhO family protein [Chloroflexi bacterium]|nr:YfhO family protein [Chloroflexota bacterium]